MERVTFLLAESNTRISCLINPDTLRLRRSAGLRPPMAGSGPITAPDQSDDPMLLSGGGSTEIDVDLLFDTGLAASRRSAEVAQVSDVRELTKPLWDLAENDNDPNADTRLAIVRLFWGQWNLACVVTAAAERWERFASDGAPTRSWLRLRLRRVADVLSTPSSDTIADATLSSEATADLLDHPVVEHLHQSIDPGIDPDGSTSGGERLEQLAERYYGNPLLWRAIAAANSLFDSPFVPPGQQLIIPKLPPQAPR